MEDLKYTLMGATCKELREIAKLHNIVGRWNMNKAELVEAIIKATSEDAGYSDDQICFESDCVINGKSKTQAKGSQKVRTTNDLIDAIEPGMLVAFKTKKDKEAALSGKFVKLEKGKLVIQTKLGASLLIDRSDVVWVRTNPRWPKWVYAMFKKDKGVTSDNAVSKV